MINPARDSDSEGITWYTWYINILVGSLYTSKRADGPIDAQEPTRYFNGVPANLFVVVRYFVVLLAVLPF